MTESTTKGRPLDDDLTRRVLAAVRSQLEDSGFVNLNIEKIASSVGCGKTTIYRRWPTKPELVAAAIVDGLKLGDMPDTGDVVEDLVEHAWQNLENFRRSKEEAKNNGLLLAMFNMDVIPIISDSFMKVRHAMGREILSRAVERGQMSDEVDQDAIIDALAGFTLFRVTLKPDLKAHDDEELRGTYRSLVRSLIGRAPEPR
ncbi:TetR/AcrR family transcriptional regulator [Brevibacterium sp. VCM10]|uniref:TetR/AcrR family transcriptional regulator n=1 Tax=Brevibacterium sp. VCM10 TaxID=1381751 RepID=UPI00047213F7|nr:TetR/AcrR family transcriptional regulator [Brevibacterium sp. VCM10]